MECGTCHKFTLGFIISFQSFMKQWIICTSPYNSDYASTTCIDLCKCDDNLIDRKSFWTLDFNWETFMQPTWAKYLGQRRKELFPFTLNNSCPLDWHWLILVSEIKNSNMSSGEMISSQQFSQCLIWLWRPCWSWTMNSIINMVYEGNFEGNFADKMNLMCTSHIIYVLSCILYWIL